MTVQRGAIYKLFLALCLAGIATAGFAGDNPTLWIIGDSTVNNGSKGLVGWGERISTCFDLDKINVQNKARGGRSSRSYFNEGLWDAFLPEIKKGDFVLMQFGHNDGGHEYFDEKGRASIPGYDDDTEEGDRPDGTHEVVHTYGWYLRRYISDAKERGATPIVLSPIPRNMWEGGDVKREDKGYGEWARKAAKKERVEFLDLNEIVADYYDDLGPDVVKKFFPGDHTHTNGDGAGFNALCVAEGLRGLDTPLKRYLVSKSRTERMRQEILEKMDD